MRYVYIIAAFIFGCVLTYLAVSIGTLESIEGSTRLLRTGSVSTPAFLDFISVMLTALTAVLAALAIGIGVVAAYTFGEIRNAAKSAAESAVKQQVDVLLSDAAIQARIDKVAFGNIQPATGAPEEDGNGG